MAAIAQLAHGLSGHIGLWGFVEFTFLFIPICLSWVYAHLPLSIGLTAMGVGVEHIVSTVAGVVLSDTERWLFCGSVALCLSILAFIHLITCSLGTTRRRKVLSAYRLGAAAFALMLGVAGGGCLR